MSWEQQSLFTNEELGVFNDNYNLIGLSGYARSGKDTVAQMLVDRWGYRRIAFADKIREFLLRINPILHDGHRLKEVVGEFGWEIAKSRDEVRRLLQDVGVVARSMFGEDFWVTAALVNLTPGEKIVVSDVRFTNEADIIKFLGGQVWRVERPGISAVNSHVSESQMDNYTADQILINSGSLDDLALLVQTRMAYAQSK